MENIEREQKNYKLFIILTIILICEVVVIKNGLEDKSHDNFYFFVAFCIFSAMVAAGFFYYKKKTFVRPNIEIVFTSKELNFVDEKAEIEEINKLMNDQRFKCYEKSMMTEKKKSRSLSTSQLPEEESDDSNEVVIQLKKAENLIYD